MAYNKKIDVQILTESQDKIGNCSAGWSSLYPGGVWAFIKGVGGREYYAAAAANTENEMRFYIRYSRKIAEYRFKTAEIRIVYDGITYNVKHIDDPAEKHLELIIRGTAINEQ